MPLVELGVEVPFNFWESRLVTDELLRAAANDPSLWPAQAERIANFDVNLRNGALAWQESAQLALKNIGPATGFLGNAIGTVVDNVGQIVTDVPSDAKALGLKMAQVGVGVAMGVLAPIPIVGQVAAAIGAIAQMLLGLAMQPQPVAKEILPPMVDYSDEVDEWVVNNQLLPATSTLDWTGLFLPRYSGEWKAHGRDGGNVAMMGSVGADGLGFMPGTQRITSALQVYWGQRGHLAEVSPELASRAGDVGSFYPGASQLATALQEQCVKAQTQMYCIDTVKIESAWEAYFRAAFELAAGIYKREKWAVRGTPLADQTLAQNQEFAKSMVSRLRVGFGNQIAGLGSMAYTPTDTGWDDTIFERFIKPWCQKVRRRQVNNLGRLIGAAYTDEKQGAFADHELLVRLRTMRAILLEHPARWKIVGDDIIDPAFRSAWFDRTVGQRLAAPGYTPATGDDVEPGVGKDPPVPRPSGGVPFGSPSGGSRGGLLLVGGGLALAAYYARKRRWI